MLNPTPDLIERAARAAHEVSRVYCLILGDEAQEAWEVASQDLRASVLEGVQLLVEDPFTTPADCHASWMDRKVGQGWRYGPIKDADKQTHPCLVEYNALPPEQRAKDHIFRAVVLGILGVPEASHAVAAIEEMRQSLDFTMSEADTAVKEVNLTVEATPEDRAMIPVHEARGVLAGAISAELAGVVFKISGMPARG